MSHGLLRAACRAAAVAAAAPYRSACAARRQRAAAACGWQQRRWWTSDRADTPGGPEKQPDPSDKALHEWDRSVSEAIAQAERELARQRGSGSADEKQGPGSAGEAQSPGSPGDAKGHRGSRPPTPDPNDGDRDDDYVVTLGRVMEGLPEQIEGFFEHGLDGALYADGIRFAEPRHSGVHIAGKSQYLGAARVLRIAMGAYFVHPRATIVRMRQLPAAPDQDGDGNNNNNKSSNRAGVEVAVRWIFEGVPRHTQLLGGHVSRFEGEFRYAMDPRTGLVAVHEVTAIHPAPPTSFIASGLARWMGWATPRGSLSLSRRH
ncbi:hypothetical protein H4R18_003357 [Coemansia javaensis]|uniref:Uncharacterized protein n=1 Tax=Coemansia javaensis TaxID=2761396 RepID=A0A9W8LHE8_9FUNG|nr:hypothetical protein H4R18_003357 [Coemansia javaensis]